MERVGLSLAARAFGAGSSSFFLGFLTKMYESGLFVLCTGFFVLSGAVREIPGREFPCEFVYHVASLSYWLVARMLWSIIKI